MQPPLRSPRAVNDTSELASVLAISPTSVSSQRGTTAPERRTRFVTHSAATASKDSP
jgi:hypothetical protein